MEQKKPKSEFGSERLSEEELQVIFQKIEKEWPIRLRLAQLAGHKCNAKNPRALMDTEFDLSIRELYLEVLFRQPHNAADALKLIQDFYK
jgi:hypothetical protein